MLIGGKGSPLPFKLTSPTMNEYQNFYFSDEQQRKQRIRQKNMQEAGHKQSIQIPSEEDDQMSFVSNLKNETLRFEITKAQLIGNRLNVILAVSKHYLQCPENQKDAQMRNFILNYFIQKAHINLVQGNFYERIDVGLNSDPGIVYQNKFLLFGVDLLTTKKIIARFCRYCPILKWVDASHCILQFQTIQFGWDFLKFQVLNFEQQKIVPWQQNQNVLARKWLELNTYMEISFVRRLFVRNLTQADQVYITTRPPPPENFQLYHRTKLEFQNLLLSNENVKRVMLMVEEDQRMRRMMDPNYKNLIKKKRIEQKKIEGLVSDRYRHENSHRERSRTRDDQRFRKDKYQDYHHSQNYHHNGNHANREPYQNNHERSFVSEYDSVAYKGNPKMYPQRYNLHKAQPQTPRQKPSYATAEKMNEIRQQLNQRQELNQSFTIQTPRSTANTHNKRDNQLDKIFESEINPHRNFLPRELTNSSKIEMMQPQTGQIHQDDAVSMNVSSQPSSSFSRINADLKKFHIGASEYSSIYENSKHQFSNINFQDSHVGTTSNFVSSQANSHLLSIVTQENNSGFFQNEVEQEIEDIPHRREPSKIQEQDDQIRDLLNVTNKLAQANDGYNFKVTKKAIILDEVEKKEPEHKKDNQTLNTKKKNPRKKQNKDILEV